MLRGEAAGGIARHVENLAERLPAHRFDVTVADPATRRSDLRRLLRDVDVVHAHGLRAGVDVMSARRGATAPVVVTWHNAPLVTGPRRAAHRLVSRYAARRADITLGASPDLTAAARRAGARDARDTFIVAPPLAAQTRSRAEMRDELGIGERPMVLAVGRLQRQKRLDVLIAAAAGWSKDPTCPVVVIAGSGPDEAELRAQGSGFGVKLLGARADVADLLAAADVVALPSMWEARSLVAQETLRAGVPLVTTRVGGLPDLVGEAAVFVPVGDPGALQKAIERVLSDPSLAGQLAAAGRAQAASWPTLDESVAALVATYRSVLVKS